MHGYQLLLIIACAVGWVIAFPFTDSEFNTMVLFVTILTALTFSKRFLLWLKSIPETDDEEMI